MLGTRRGPSNSSSETVPLFLVYNSFSFAWAIISKSQFFLFFYYNNFPQYGYLLQTVVAPILLRALWSI
jgi:hypothetical protein